MSLRLYGTISGCGRAAGAVIPSLGSGRYAPGPNIGLPSSLKCEAPKYTINAGWGQPGSLATVSIKTAFIERLNLSIRQHVAAVGRRVVPSPIKWQKLP